MEWEEGNGPDVEALANLLWDQGIQISPAEIHGCLSGLLAGNTAPDAESALAALAALVDADIYGEMAAIIMDLYRLAADQLCDEDFDFYPLLPDDDDDISTRTNALAGWCKGFLSGFAHRAGDTASVLAEDSSEVLRDFAAIAEAVVEGEASDGADDDEGLEESYAELVEYVRIAALNVYLDSRAEPRSGEEPPALH
jgi:uncharacterized protein YgfB (UPF0149 family)